MIRTRLLTLTIEAPDCLIFETISTRTEINKMLLTDEQGLNTLSGIEFRRDWGCSNQLSTCLGNFNQEKRYRKESSSSAACVFHPTLYINDWRTGHCHVAALTIPTPTFNKLSILHTITEIKYSFRNRHQSDRTILQRSGLMD
jgi:hypothetical protein